MTLPRHRRAAAIALSSIASLALLGGTLAVLTDSDTTAPKVLTSGTVEVELVEGVGWDDELLQLGIGDTVTDTAVVVNSSTLDLASMRLTADLTDSVGEFGGALSEAVEVDIVQDGGTMLADDVRLADLATGYDLVFADGRLPAGVDVPLEFRYAVVGARTDQTGDRGTGARENSSNPDNRYQGSSLRVSYTIDALQRDVHKTTAPDSLDVTLDGDTATVSFTEPKYNPEGTSYTATATPTGTSGVSTTTTETATLSTSMAADAQTRSATGPSSPLTITGLAQGTSYEFTVTATSPRGETSVVAATSLVATQTLAPATDLSVADGTMALTWTASSSTFAEGYRIYRSAVDGELGEQVATLEGRATTTWTDPAPNPGTNYYTVRAYAYGWESTVATASGVLPVTPGEVGVAVVGDSATITFDTGANPDGTTYTVTADPAGAGLSATGTSSPLTITGLTQGTTYTFAVTSTTPRGATSSAVVSDPVTTSTLAAPTGLRAAEGTMVLTWSPSTSPEVEGYRIFRSATAGSYGSPVATLGSAAAATWTDPNPFTGRNYYAVRAYAGSWTSPLATAAADKLLAPDSVSVSLDGDTATVTFTPPATNPAGTVYTAAAGPGLTVAGTGSPLTITGLAQGTSYTFTVLAAHNGTTTAATSSPPVTTATLAAPASLTVTGSGPLTLSWPQSASTFTQGYRIWRSDTAGSFPGAPVATIGSRGTTSWVDSAAPQGRSHYLIRSYAGSWTSTGSASGNAFATKTVTDTFDGSGTLAATATGGETWQSYNGTFTRSGGRAITATAASSNPFAAVDMGSPTAEVTTSMVNRSGEAAYYRVVDGNDWNRTRVRRHDYQTSYYVTEYGHPVYSTQYEYNDMRQVPQWQPRIQEISQTTTTYAYSEWSAWAKNGVESECRNAGMPTWGANDVYDSYGIVVENRRWVSYGKGNKGCGPLYEMWYVEAKSRTRNYVSSSAAWVTSCTASDTAWSVVSCGSTRLTNSGSPYYATSARSGYDYQTGGYTYWGYGTYWAYSPADGNDTATGRTQQVQTGTTWSTAYCSGCPTKQTGPYYTDHTDYYLVTEQSVNGTVTTRNSTAVGTISSMRVEVSGTTAKVYADNTLVATVSVPAHTGATRHGVGLGGSDTTSPTNGPTNATLIATG